MFFGVVLVADEWSEWRFRAEHEIVTTAIRQSAIPYKRRIAVTSKVPLATLRS
jgi:hypothetical protein